MGINIDCNVNVQKVDMKAFITYKHSIDKFIP